MLELIIKLILAHLIGDFVFQPKIWVIGKEKKKHKSIYLYAHIVVHLIALLVLLKFNTQYVFAILTIIFSHYIIDVTKLLLNDKYNKRILFFIDQFLHFTVIFFVAFYYFTDTEWQQYFFTSKKLLFVACLIFATFSANIILMVLLSKWNVFNNKEDSLDSAGKYIGFLERIFIFFFVVMGYPLGIGFLVTAKTVFRYNDLTRAKDRKLTEYVLIGSFLSFGIAIFSGLVYNYLLHFL